MGGTDAGQLLECVAARRARQASGRQDQDGWNGWIGQDGTGWDGMGWDAHTDTHMWASRLTLGQPRDARHGREYWGLGRADVAANRCFA